MGIEAKLAADDYELSTTMAINVTFINQTLDLGGAEIFNTDLLTELSRQGVEIQAFTTEPRFVQLLKKNQVTAQQIPVIMDLIGNWKGLVKAVFYFPYGFYYYWRLVVTHRSTDVFLLSSFTEKIFVTSMANFYHIPVVWLEFGPVSPLFKKFWSFPDFLYRQVSRLPAKVIVPSLHTQADLIKGKYFLIKQLAVIPCGRKLALEKINSKKIITEPLLVCVSRLEPGKGQNLLIQAFSIVNKKIPKSRLLITGDSPWKKELESLVKRLNLEKNVDFVGRVPDSLLVMSQAQVCVFPSTWELEGFGLVTIEAMALGKPIVAFAVGPTVEILQDHRNGWLAKKGNIDDLAEKLLFVLTHPTEAQRAAHQAQLDFKEKYQIEMVAKKYISEFELLQDRK